MTAAGPMNAMERRSVLALSGVISSRMFGLFLLLPVLALYAAAMPGSTPFLVGLALGIYGLTQALFQLSFGMCSDIFGRKGVITLGLFVFIAGSVIAALSDTLPWLIAGRAIQGAGAVSSAVLALTADLTREEQRTKAMALIGISIGAVFLTSMALAPVLSLYIGIPGLFWLTAGLGVVALLLLHGVVPSPSRHLRHRDVTPTASRVPAVLRDPQLMRLNVGALVLHLVLTALFVVLPAELSRMGDMALHEHWKVYFPVLLLSVIGMVPLIAAGSRADRIAPMFRVAIFLLLAGLGGMSLMTWGDGGPFLWLAACLWVFFCGFNALGSHAALTGFSGGAGSGQGDGHRRLQYLPVLRRVRRRRPVRLDVGTIRRRCGVSPVRGTGAGMAGHCLAVPGVPSFILTGDPCRESCRLLAR